MVGAAEEDVVRQTMLHEIAHALVGYEAAHGPVWKRKAAEIGYTGKRTAANPYVEQQRKLREEGFRAANRVRAEAGVVGTAEGRRRLRSGETGVITRGKYAGLRATVHSVGSTRYRADLDGVGSMYIPFEMLTLVPGAGPVASSVQRQKVTILRRGDEGVINSGKHAGRKVKVVDVGRSAVHRGRGRGPHGPDAPPVRDGRRSPTTTQRRSLRPDR